MKKQLATLLAVTLTGLAGHHADASVVVSNLDPANPVFGENSPKIGEAILTGSRPISLSSVMFLQTSGATSGETFAVYSRNTDGTLGTSLFTAFTLSFDPTMSVETATVSAAFTLQPNSGYFFVLSSGTTGNAEWSYTSSTDYAAAFGVSLPATSTAFFTTGTTTVYRSLAAGPQEFQVNGIALAAVPEPSTDALIGLALAGGVALLARRRVASTV